MRNSLSVVLLALVTSGLWSCSENASEPGIRQEEPSMEILKKVPPPEGVARGIRTNGNRNPISRVDFFGRPSNVDFADPGVATSPIQTRSGALLLRFLDTGVADAEIPFVGAQVTSGRHEVTFTGHTHDATREYQAFHVVWTEVEDYATPFFEPVVVQGMKAERYFDVSVDNIKRTSATELTLDIEACRSPDHDPITFEFATHAIAGSGSAYRSAVVVSRASHSSASAAFVHELSSEDVAALMESMDCASPEHVGFLAGARRGLALALPEGSFPLSDPVSVTVLVWGRIKQDGDVTWVSLMTATRYFR